MGLLAPESHGMHRTIIMFMVLQVGGRGAAGFRITRNVRTVVIFMALEVGERGAAGSRIIRNA